jgi:hypothetical protein
MNAEIVLLAAVFLVLLIAMILTIILSTNTIARFSEIGDSLEAALANVFDTFATISTTLIAQLTAFGRSAIAAFSSFATQLGSGYLSINTFIQTEVTSIINYIGRQSLALIDKSSRLILQGGLAFANATVQMIDALSFLLAQAAAFVAETIATVTVLLIQIFATAINFVISEIGKLIADLKEIVQTFINAVEPAILDIFCGVCYVCCNIPEVSCGLSNNSGASCCCVDGCGHCGPDQYNVCNNETSC